MRIELQTRPANLRARSIAASSPGRGRAGPKPGNVPFHLQRPSHPRARAGFLETDLVIAVAILVVALLPLAYSFVADQRNLRVASERAAAMQLVDGEMELLAAGSWRQFPPGTNVITLTGNATANLTTNRALLIIETNVIRLEWRPARRASTGIIREVQRP
jgi:hypothetical protein